MLTRAICLLAGGTASSSSESRPRRILDNLEDTAAADTRSDSDRTALPSYANSSSATRTSADPRDAQGLEQDEGYFDSSMAGHEHGSDANAASDQRSFNEDANSAGQPSSPGQPWASQLRLSNNQEQEASPASRTASARAASSSGQDAFSSLLEDTAPQESRRRYGVRSRRARDISSQGSTASADIASSGPPSSQVDRRQPANAASESNKYSSSASAAPVGPRDRRSRLAQEASAGMSQGPSRQRHDDRARPAAAAAQGSLGNRNGSSSSSRGNPQSSWYVDWGWDADPSQDQPGASSQRPARDRQISDSASDVSSSSKSSRRQKARDATASAGSRQQGNGKGRWWQGFGPQKQNSSEDEPAGRSSSKATAEGDAFATDGIEGVWETVDDTAPDEPLVRPDITRLDPAELVSSSSFLFQASHCRIKAIGYEL